MKIFVNARFLTQPVSGVQRYGIECSRQIKRLYPDAVFIAPKNILHTDVANELNVQIAGRNTGQKWEQFDLPFYLGRQKAPPLLNLANTAPIFYSNNYVTIHDLAFYHHPEWNSKKFSMWYNILIPRIAISSKHIFTVSNTIKNELVKFYKLPAAKISVAYNGISRKMLEKGNAKDIVKEKIILSVGTFNIRKNHQNLVKGYINSNISNEYSLVMIGDKNRIFKESDVEEHMLKRSNIRVMPSLKEDDLIALYKKAEIVASVSLYEGFGIPLLEGLYNGCKIVCSDIPVYREVYSQCATFCSPTDTDDIGKGLETAVTKDTVSQEEIVKLLQQCNYERSARTMLEKIVPGYK
ncbi:MAG: hypothetical protein K0Q79_1283 [Flavipsychrobacter sp.]|jgi:glycosyltransferase involved in cell wall biosynthesis|nr:hypothetical protein [Flavipsychrobacter sp.]